MKLFTRSALMFFICTLSAFCARAQLVANFTADHIAGCSPLVVNFHNTTTPMSGTTFDWYGVGTGVLHLTDCSGSFIAPGTYTVTLTAHNGSSTSSHSVTITVYPSPTVSFYADDTTICPGTTVTFTSTSTPGVPGTMTCVWNFGDGFSSTGLTATHTYTSPGLYNVTLSVTNSDGCVSSLTKPAYIWVYTPASPGFSSSSTYFCHPPGHAVFTNLTSGFGPFSYTWRFGDGSSPFTGTTPTHDYVSTGSYPVTLVVTDGHGCTDSVVVPSYITVGDIHASFTFPTTACVYSTVTFPNTSTPHISSSWDYGDGHSSTGDPGSNMYSTPGVYHVRLIIFDGSCYDTITHDITILPGPTASFVITPAHACPPPVTLSFAATVPSGTIVTWLYGDGGTGSGVTSTHTYGYRGVDTIKMISVDPVTGCRDTVKQIDTLFDMIHWITASPYSGCKPLPVTFTPHMMTWMPDTLTLHPYPFPVATYSWNFADGSPTSSAMSPTHTYTAVGVYNVILTSVTSNGCTIYDTVQIRVGTPPVVTFSATPTHTCYHNNVINFTVNVITGPVDSFVWQFGDGGGLTTGAYTTSYHFTRPGTFSVTVTPYYNGCPGAPFSILDYITLDSPMSVISANVFCSPPKRVQFGDSSLGDDTHVWIFGDGSTSTLDNPLHDYPLAIVYTVTLTTYNIASGCRDTTSRVLDFHRPVVSFSTPDTAICKDDHVVFTATFTGGGSISLYEWGHPAFWTTGPPSISDTFHTPGIYTIRLVTLDQNNCPDTVTRVNYMLVAKPSAHFNVVPPTGCWPLTTTFTDASTDVPGTFFTNFAWTFGDGGFASVTAPSVNHTFTAAGTFTTTEIVTDNVGCKDTVVSSLVTVYRPTAVFSAAPLHICRYDSTHFTNTSTGIVGSFWMFGDGGTSTANSPWHTYTASGTYTVKLVVTDVHGCTDTSTRVNYINVHQPHASFTMSDSVSICPPLMVIFNNTSTGGIFYNWDLGDGSSSTAFAPSDLYITTGFDTVRLIVSDMYSCRDTAWGHVNIFGYAGAFSYGPLTGCAPLTVNFNATTLNVPNIIWDFADGHTSTVAFTDTISHVYTLPGAYVPKLILSDNTGCQNSSIGIDTIKVDLVTPNFKTVPNPVCLGDTFTLVDSSYSFWSTITNWNWTMNGGSTTVPSPSFYIAGVGVYPAVLVVTDGWGCTATVTKDVTIYDLPDIKACPDTIICVGDAATLTAYGGVSYVWSPPATLSCTTCNPASASPTVVTTYTVTGTDTHGCANTDTVTVSLKTNTVSIARGDTEVCAGVPVPLYDSGGTKYTWIPATGLSDPHSPNPVATPGATTKYTVIAQLAGCIPDTNYVLVLIHPIPTVDAGPDQTLVAGSTAQLSATGHLIHDIWWDDARTLSCDSCYNPVASMPITTTYFVTVASDFGCKNSDSVTIHIFCDNSQIFIPNSFTPNNDGMNDVFYPRGAGVKTVKSFRIYNRWGQLLFERGGINLNDASNAWDGTYMGDKPHPDVYVYVLEAICDTGEPINIKGDVTIIR